MAMMMMVMMRCIFSHVLIGIVSIIIRVSRRQWHEINCINGGITGDVVKAMMMEASAMIMSIISAMVIRYMVTGTGCEVGYMGFI